MKHFFRQLKERLANKAGMTTLEVAISVIIVLMALGGFVDMVNTSQKLDTASSVTGYVGRVVANQGGVRTAPTVHHVGNYVTSDQLYREVSMILKNGGVPEEDFKLLINNKVIKPGTNIPLQDFGKRMKVELKVAYRWDMISQLVPGDMEGEKVSSREVISSFKVRQGNIESEYGAPTP